MTSQHSPEAGVDLARYQRFARFARFIADQAPPSIDKLERYRLIELTESQFEDVHRLYEIYRDVQAEESERLERILALFRRYPKARTVRGLAFAVGGDIAGQTVVRDWIDLDDEAEDAARRLGKTYEGMLIDDDGIEDPGDDPNFWIACLRAGVLGSSTQ